jgi:hypothetical protein
MTNTIRSARWLGAFLLLALTATAQAQGNNGRGKCMEPFGVSFYEVAPGFKRIPGTVYLIIYGDPAATDN